MASEPSRAFNYKEERLENQIQWYSRKARYNKTRYKTFQTIILVAGAMIPLINIVDFLDLSVRIITSLLGGVIIVITGLTLLQRYEENWILYRATVELLKREKYLYENETGDYYALSDPQKNRLLVERVESIVSPETSRYFATRESQRVTTTQPT